jgi:ABC-type branched-subunit amino acid transport system ATPase component/predicted MFS family arabinose efflux permease
MSAPRDGDETELASLTSTVLTAEAERLGARVAVDEPLPDSRLPGAGGAEMSLRDGIARGGAFTFVVLTLLNSLDELETAAVSILAPDIQRAFGVSDGAIVFVATASGAFLMLGALPMGWLADRYRRGRIIGISSLVFAVMVACAGLATNILTFFCARLGVGIAKANTLPVHSSLIADAYPIGVRGRLATTKDSAGRLVAVCSPLVVAGIAAAAGPPNGWRWAFLLTGIPVAVLAFLAFRLPEPPRGQFEKADVVGDVYDDENPAPISIEAAFARLLKIRTLKSVLVAFAAMGFGLFTAPVLQNLFLEDHFGLGTLGRGVVGSTMGVGVLVTLPWVGRYYDRLYREHPDRALALVGKLVLPAALLTPVQYFMPNVWLFTLLGIPHVVLLSSAFAMVSPLMQTVVPYRLRGMGSALGAIYIFFVGATGGALIAGLISNAWGTRAAVICLGVPSTIIGGMLLIRSSTFIRDDLTMIVEEIEEEAEERRRQLTDPASTPALHVVGVDFSYGHVQVLFDVGFEVKRGEVLALLGTNGSGKSTLLRVVAGLGTPARGAVRLHGRTITFVTPEQRTRMGIHMLPGGKGVFPQMTIRANLVMGGYQYRRDRVDLERRIERVLDMFPTLAARQGQMAGSLSGGEQQMLALARTLLHDPDVLIIDELSLGLAPIVVEQLLETIEVLKGEGLTIILVEQSLNVALTVADRAIFLEKGRVRFDGPASELLGRDDLARAVFFGAEGG